MKVVLIRWLDARQQDGPASLISLDEQKGLIMTSAGILASEDDEVVRLVQDTYEWTDDGEAAFRRAVIIPKSYILNRQEWEVKDAPE